MSDLWEWIDADGSVHTLTQPGVAKVLKGVEGDGMPPVSFVEDEVAFQPGSRLRTVKTGARLVSLPMAFLAASSTELQAQLRAWLLALHADRGDGQLRYTGPDGTARVLACRYADGMGLVKSADTRMPTWQKAVVAFRAFDPYWYDAADVTIGFTAEDAPSFFPFFPLVLGAASVFSGLTVTNDGDVEAWPVWTIQGPCDSVTLRNLTTGKVLTLARSLSFGGVVEIDTRPGEKSVTLAATGANLYGDLASGSSLWSLPRGANTVRIEMDGTDGNSAVTMGYRRRYLGA